MKLKITKYLRRAEEIFNCHLQRPLGSGASPSTVRRPPAQRPEQEKGSEGRLRRPRHPQAGPGLLGRGRQWRSLVGLECAREAHHLLLLASSLSRASWLIHFQTTHRVISSPVCLPHRALAMRAHIHLPALHTVQFTRLCVSTLRVS